MEFASSVRTIISKFLLEMAVVLYVLMARLVLRLISHVGLVLLRTPLVMGVLLVPPANINQLREMNRVRPVLREPFAICQVFNVVQDSV